MMNEPEVEKFKVWPTKLDQKQFIDVMASGSRVALEEKHPLTRKKYARKYDPRPRMIEAYLFFHDELTNFFFGENSEPPLCAELALASRLEEAFQALKNALKVAVVDLEQGDDAQVIFETLNSRGEPLLPADLLRNYIFLRAARLGEPQEELYEKYWLNFDDDFWRHEIKQGRLKRPRSDLFMQHFLASREARDIPIKHLFVEYKHWIERKSPFQTVTEELATLSIQGENFRRIIAPKSSDILFSLSKCLSRFEISTVYPLILFLQDKELTPEDWIDISVTLESYIVRRAVCGYTTKNYNRVFLSLIRALQNKDVSPEMIRAHLSESRGESTEWPGDDVFANAWMTQHIYRHLNNPKVVHIFRKLNDTYLNSKSEDISIDSQLTVEHIMPQKWIDHWPLANGTKGLSFWDLFKADPADPEVVETRNRESKIQTLGNLTILTQALNTSVSNNSWDMKKPELMKSSLLPINQQLHGYDIWDEDSIDQRGAELLKYTLEIWPKAGLIP